MVERKRLLAPLVLAALIYVIPGVAIGYTTEITRLEWGLQRVLVYLADLHLRGPRRDIVELVSSLNPDILVLGGDTWDELTPSLNAIEEALRLLRRSAKIAVAVLGNHEVWSSRSNLIPLEDGIAFLEELGYIVLRDDYIDIDGVRIGGIEWRDNPKHYREPVEKLSKMCDIIVAHSPDVLLYTNPQHELLVLAGHTHGGQVCLPGSRSLYTNSVYGYYWGLYRRGLAVMYVSRGLGEMILPRVFCPREVVIVI